jgi:hypothetical protein
MAKHSTWETVRLQGEQVVDEARRIIHEGNVRRVVVKQEGQVVAEFPLTVGIVASVAAPVLAAIGALVALLTDCTIDLERRRATVTRVKTASGWKTKTGGKRAGGKKTAGPKKAKKAARKTAKKKQP